MPMPMTDTGSNAGLNNNLTKDISTTIGNILSTSANGLQNTYNGYVNAQIAAAAMANSASAEAQRAQYNYNKELMNLQNLKQDEYLQRMFDFNTESAAKANEFTEKMWNKAADYNTNIFNAENAFNENMWQKTADYNSLEAKAQRAWQEEMSNTAYQRAVKDMRAAGINPILAAQNGGANVGSGATASISHSNSGSANMGAISGAQANGGLAGAAGGSVGNYSGQGYHLSDTMAIMGGVLGTLGEVLTAFQSYKTGTGSAIQNGVVQTAEAIKDTVNDVTQIIENKSNDNKNSYSEYNEKYGDSFWDWINAKNYEYWHKGSEYKKGTYGFNGNLWGNTGHKF